MKVADLISTLQEFNPSANVSLTTSEDIAVSYISEDNATKQTTGQVFIEGCDSCQLCFHYNEEYCNFYNRNCEEVNECYQFTRDD